jgi:hypothetical protein
MKYFIKIRIMVLFAPIKLSLFLADNSQGIPAVPMRPICPRYLVQEIIQFFI